MGQHVIVTSLKNSSTQAFLVSKLVAILKLGKGSAKRVSRISWILHEGLGGNQSTSSVLEHAPDIRCNSCKRLYV